MLTSSEIFDDYREIERSYSIGRRTGMQDSSTGTDKVAWSYDARGRTAMEYRPVDGSGTFRTEWGYNSADQVSWMRYPGGNTGKAGEQISYGYLDQGAVSTVFSDTYS